MFYGGIAAIIILGVGFWFFVGRKQGKFHAQGKEMMNKAKVMVQNAPEHCCWHIFVAKLSVTGIVPSNSVTNKSEPWKDKVVNASSGNRRGYSDLEKGNKQADQPVGDETDYSYEEDQARGPWTVRAGRNYGTNRSWVGIRLSVEPWT